MDPALWIEPAPAGTGQPLDRMSKLHAAVGKFCADLLVFEIDGSAELSDPPLGDAVRDLLVNPPCDLLVVRNCGDSQATFANEP